MTDDDLIRRGDALAAVHDTDSRELAQHGESRIADRIATLPAVTVGEDVAKAAIDRAIARLQALPNHAGRPAWDAIVAEEIRAALEPVAAQEVQSLHEDLVELAEDYRRAVEVIFFYAQRGVVSPPMDDQINEDGGDKARAYLARYAPNALIQKGAADDR